MKPSLFDCIVATSIEPYTTYLDQLSPSDRFTELHKLVDEMDDEQTDRELANTYRLAILRHYKAFLFRSGAMTPGEEPPAVARGEEAIQAQAQDMAQLYAELRDQNLPAIRYSTVVCPVVARVLVAHFRAGDYQHCEVFINELYTQKRYQDLHNLSSSLLNEVAQDELHLYDEQAQATAHELDLMVQKYLLTQPITKVEPFELLPSYSSKKKLDAYFHRPDQELPIGMLPNPNPEIEEAFKLFINRRDTKGLVDYVEYHISAFAQDPDRLAAGHVETCYLIAVLLYYYDWLGADPDLSKLIKSLKVLLITALQNYLPRFKQM